MILEGVFEQPIGEDFETEEIELGGQYEIVERHGDGFGLACLYGGRRRNRATGGCVS